MLTLMQCNEAYASNDVIPILPTSETDIARLTLRMKTLKDKGLAHSLKKIAGSSKKKRKLGADEVIEPDAETNKVDMSIPAAAQATISRVTLLKDSAIQNSPMTSKSTTPQPRSGTSTPKAAAATINNAATASLTAKVLQEQEQLNKRRKLEENKNINTLYAPSKKGQKDIDFMNRGFSMQRR